MARREEKDQRYIKVRQLKTMILIRAELRASYEKERSLAHESTANEPFVCIERKRGFFCSKVLHKSEKQNLLVESK